MVIFGIAGADVALAALAYRHDIGATVRARAIVEPWTISIAAGVCVLIFPAAEDGTRSRDGLIIAYVISVTAGMIASLWPLYRSYGLPPQWKPNPAQLLYVARLNIPLAAADAIEWGSRRLDIAILGLFVAPYWVGVYYVGQQVASLPQKLKTSFDPILAPVITQKLAEGDRQAVAKQVRQVGFWVIAAQAGIALALGIPGEAVMGVVGAAFVGGTGALAFLLAAEVVAATAAVSEAALVYVARHRNLMISALMIAVQAALTILFILGVRRAAAAAGEPPGLPGRQRRGGLDAGARAGLHPQGAAALPPARRAGPGLALAAGLGGSRRRGRRPAVHDAAAVARMGRAGDRHSRHPGDLRNRRLVEGLHP